MLDPADGSKTGAFVVAPYPLENTTHVVLKNGRTRELSRFISQHAGGVVGPGNGANIELFPVSR